jgi:hypothetical protein
MSPKQKQKHRKPDRREKCWATKKVRWMTETEAQHQLELLKFFGECWHKEQRVYCCRHCGGWHLTSQVRRGPESAAG